MTKKLRWISGSVSAVWVGAFLSSCATPRKSPGTYNPDSHKQFQSLDANKDGRLTYAEFLKAPMAKKSKNPKALFDQIDANHDGHITIPEWRDYRLKHKKNN